MNKCMYFCGVDVAKDSFKEFSDKVKGRKSKLGLEKIYKPACSSIAGE